MILKRYKNKFYKTISVDLNIPGEGGTGLAHNGILSDSLMKSLLFQLFLRFFLHQIKSLFPAFRFNISFHIVPIFI